MRKLLNRLGQLLFDRGDLFHKHRDIHPDRLAHDDWNNKQSMTFIFDPFNHCLYVEPYPNFHQDLIHRSGIGKKLLGEEYDPGGTVNPSTGGISTGTGRWDMVDRGYVLGRFGYVGAFRKTPAITFWNSEETHIATALKAILQEYPHLQTEETLVKQEGRALGLIKDYQTGVGGG